MPRLLLVDRHGFQLCVVPDKRPKILGVDVTEALQPIGDALRFAALKPLRDAIKQIVVRIELSLRMRPGILVALVSTRQRSFEHIAKVKDVVAARQHRMRDILMHQAETRPVI